MHPGAAGARLGEHGHLSHVHATTASSMHGLHHVERTAGFFFSLSGVITARLWRGSYVQAMEPFRCVRNTDC